jgi:microcystin-dependent protein
LSNPNRFLLPGAAIKWQISIRGRANSGFIRTKYRRIAFREAFHDPGPDFLNGAYFAGMGGSIMSDYFIGEIRVFSFDWAPRGWALCNGAILNVQQNQALFSLLGNQFGGDGKVTFALPDFQGRAPVNRTQSMSSPNSNLASGSENVALTTAQMPAHNHPFYASTAAATTTTGTDRVPAVAQPDVTQKIKRPIYGSTAASVTLNSGSIGFNGNSAPHPNMQPFGVFNFCISTTGIYPTRDGTPSPRQIRRILADGKEETVTR